MRKRDGAIASGMLLIWILACGSPYPNQPPPSKTSAPELEKNADPVLEALSWSWHSTSGYAIAEGEVKNISGSSMKSVMAVVTWRTKSGEFITSDDALIDYNPVLAGQTSPFKVMATFNPAMNTAELSFKTLFGSTLPHKDSSKKK